MDARLTAPEGAQRREQDGVDRSRHVESKGGAGRMTRPAVAAIAVWGVWSLLLLSHLILAVHFGHNVPFQDEIRYADVLTGERRMDARWLWALHAEHRIPAAKLLWIGTLHLSGYDFRIGNLVTISMLAAMAAGLVWAAGSMRGRTHFTDALIPLLVLNPGHGLVLVWFWCINHVLAPLIASAVLLLIVWRSEALPRPRALLVGLALPILVLCGPGGIPYALAFAVWLLIWGWWSWTAPGAGGRWAAALAWSLAMAGVLTVAFYFLQFEHRSTFVAAPTWRRAIASIVRVTGLGLGLGVVGPYWAAIGAILVALGLGTAAMATFCWKVMPPERVRWAGVLLFLAAVGALAFSVGRARGGMPASYLGSQGQHGLLMLPGLVCVYFAWLLSGVRGARALVPFGMLAASACLLWPNYMAGLDVLRYYSEGMEQFERDAYRGMPPPLAAERHRSFLSAVVDPAQEDARLPSLAADMRRLQRGAFQPFRHMLPDAALRLAASLDEPALLQGVGRHGGAFRGTGGRPCVTYVLPEPRHIAAIRLQLSFDDAPSGPANFRASWDERGCLGRARAGQSDAFVLERNGRVQTRTVWVDQTIARFCVCPDSQPCVFRIASMQLLVHNAAPTRLTLLSPGPDPSARTPP